MIKFIDVTGKTEDEAIQSALAQLKMDRDDVSVEILAHDSPEVVLVQPLDAQRVQGRRDGGQAHGRTDR